MNQDTNNQAFMQNAAQFMQTGQNMMQQFMDTLNKQSSMTQYIQMPTDSAAVSEIQKDFAAKQMALWQSVMLKHQGKESTFKVAPNPGDRRFSAAAWHENPFYDYLHQAYLLNVQMMEKVVEQTPTPDTRSKDKMRFLARQITDAFSPANFAATNPEFIKKALESQGKSITDGVNNLVTDMQKGRISVTDESAFEIGKNLAMTEGVVIFENALMQLIQYKALTEEVGTRPLLVVPPSINKFYVMDLQPDNSLIRYLVEQGNTVFLVSWVNPKEKEAKLTWDDYLEKGVIKAVHTVQEFCKVKDINTLGFCVGGTLLTSSLAVLKARGENAVASMTLLTTLLDFSDTGEIGLLIDENFLASKESTIGQGGLLPAADLQSTFSFLRPNDLIWNYVISNYLKGEKPTAFDILYWNGDSTNMPGPFACWYIRNMYHENNLRIPGKLSMCGEKVDLGSIDFPTYLLATREDHIVPWTSAYQTTRLFSGTTRFVLGASGHIAGVINPANKNKRNYWVNENTKNSPENWLATAEEKKGSWWSDWAAWNKPLQGKAQKARTLGNDKYPMIEAAPGRYVKVRAV